MIVNIFSKTSLSGSYNSRFASMFFEILRETRALTCLLKRIITIRLCHIQANHSNVLIFTLFYRTIITCIPDQANLIYPY